MMMHRVLEPSNNSENHQSSINCLSENHDYDKRTQMDVEAQLFLQQKRIIDDSHDGETCDKSESGEDLNVDVENDDNSCPVDLTRRQDEKFTFENLIPKDNSDFKLSKTDEQDSVLNRSESVCSDVSRSDSPRDVVSPSVVSHNRRLAFSVENILDPNKFTGRQSVYSDSGSNGMVNCCWKPHQDVNTTEMVGEDGKNPFSYCPHIEHSILSSMTNFNFLLIYLNA